ncbi:glucose-1-phosphate thymidylyltransferase [Streptomyces sp. NPDC060000]|uniref:glucose-1-phosphate thymidylyltransferase n=1 Tax=Streptomyces sp. NPDC060000 TaxID=3347031 RepID=UPI0036CFEFBF
MKALVLSGGAGTRLRPFSHSMPKQLIPVANKPVLEHVLDNIVAIGVTDIGIVVGDWEPEITAVLGDGSRLGARLTYLRQDKPLGLAHCVSVARDFLGEDDFVMYLGDCMLVEGVAEAAEEFARVRPAAHVVVHKVADPSAFGVVEMDPEGTVRRLVEKPREARSDLALTGVYFFTPDIHRAIAAIEPSERGELEITDAIQWLVTDGAEVRAGRYHGYWKDTGRIDDVLECNRKLLDGLVRRIDGEVDEASELSGAVVVEPGATVVRSRIEGPAVIGAGTRVEDCVIGPHTSAGRGCALTGSHLDYSIVLDGAEIHRAGRLHGSVIGRFAVVGPVTDDDNRRRLVIGDHSRVQVAG